MNDASVVLMAAACSLDNIVVGVAFGARGIRVPLGSNLLIALVTAAGTLVSLLSGRLLSLAATPARAHVLGSAAIMLLGAWMIVREAVCRMAGDRPRALAGLFQVDGVETLSTLLSVLDDPVIGLMSVTGVLGLRESVLIGIALTLNNVAVGLGAGIAGSSPVLLAATLVAFSMAGLSLGMRAGRRLMPAWLREVSGPLAGTLLVLSGVRELIR